MPRRPRSALFQLLDAVPTDEKDRLEEYEPGDLRPEESGEDAADRPFCPILYEDTGRAGCRDIDCGSCALLLARLEEAEAVYVWVCSTCCDGFHVEGYWTAGACELCGFTSSVLMLCVEIEP